MQRAIGDPVIQVGAEPSAAYLVLQVAICRTDQPEIRLVPDIAADALEGSFLNDPQQLRLQREFELADLVEKQGAVPGQCNRAVMRRDRAGECTALMTEQLAAHELARQGGAVDDDQIPLARPAIERVR